VSAGSSKTYTVSYTSTTQSNIYVLAVGGGGGGGAMQWGGSGGGGGGVVMQSVSLPASSSTINITVGGGGAGGYAGNPSPTGAIAAGNGVNTTIVFNGNTSANITAWGGGAGGANNSTNYTAPGNGGSGGGATTNGSGTNYPPGSAINNYNNYGNQGAPVSFNQNPNAASGGGAGTAGSYNATGQSNRAGDGIQCFLPGITNFSASGTTFASTAMYGGYYWGAGGGGANYSSLGLGGGGNGVTSGNGGSGAANSGGGGGGCYISNQYGGNGGSGIVIIAFPQTPITSNAQAVLPATLFSSGKAVDVLSYDTTFNGTKTGLLSSGAYASIKGAFSCKLVNYNYFGPVLTLRYSTDLCGNYTQNFYADVSGNLGTGYLGTGQSVISWLNANTGSSITTNNVFLYPLTSGTIPASWTNSGTSTSATVGNPGPSIYLPNGSAVYGNSGLNSFLNKTIYFDLQPSATVASSTNWSCFNLRFACDSNGSGTVVSFNLGTQKIGFQTSSSFTQATQAITSNPISFTFALSTFYSFYIYINASGLAYLYYNTGTTTAPVWTLQNSTGFSIINNGNYMGFQVSDFYPSYIDNIQIIDNAAYAYVTKWYDQGMDLSFNSATQYTLGSQPIYDVANGLINFGYVGAGATTPSGWTNSSSSSSGVNASNPNAYFKLPDYALPYCPSASYDTSFSYTYRHGNVLTGINAATVVGGGTSGSGKAFSAQIYTNGATAYLAEWYALAGTSISPYAANSVFSVTYQASGTTTASAEYLYLTQGSTVNTISTGLVSSIRQQTPNNNAIGYNLAWGNAPLNGQLYNMYYFSSSLFNQDRTLVEATPYQYSAPAAITGLATSSPTVTNFVLGWTAYTGATLYTIYVNSVFITSTTLISLTITPGFYGPWNINVYAFNASNALIATGYITLNVSPVVTIIPITNNVSWPAVSNTLTTQSLTATNTGYAALNGTYTVTCSIAATNADTRVYIGAILSNNNGLLWQSPSGIYAVSAGTVGGQNLYTVNTGRSTTASGTSYSGEWFTFQFPAPITLSIFTIAQQWGPPSNIYQFYLVGSNDGSTWTYMYGATAAYNAGTSTQNFTVNSSQGFTYIRFIVNSVAANQGIWLSYVNMTGNGIGF
jgi:hypothetical protein